MVNEAMGKFQVGGTCFLVVVVVGVSHKIHKLHGFNNGNLFPQSSEVLRSPKL